MTNYVYLRLGAGKQNANDNITNVIPLKVNRITISTSKTIPDMPVPFSGLLTGESVNVALDLGMARKTLSLQGYILESQLTKKFGKETTSKTNTFTAIEIAQMIHSSVDSTGIQPYQAINELIFLYESKVRNDYTQSAATLVPFNWHSRGLRGELDNLGAILSSPYPDDENAEGLKGYIERFSCEIDSTTIDISFSMEFAIAHVFPSGNVATTIADAIS
jgi:hypothetical protein